MFDDWLDILLRGSLDLNLPAITLSFGDGIGLTGSGHLIWNSDAGLHVRAVTGGVSEVYARLRQLGTPGQLLLDEEYLTASGRTQCGWEMTASRVPFGGSTLDPDSAHVAWDLTPGLLDFNRATLGPRPCNRSIRALLGPPPERWIRSTETEIRNEHFGGRRVSLDWLSARTNVGIVAARLRSEECFEVRVLLDGGFPQLSTMEILRAILRAFSFLIGRGVFARGFENSAPDHETRSLWPYQRTPSRNSLLPPLGIGSAFRAGTETLLGRAIDFFLTERGQRAAEHLELCWDTADNTLPTRLAVTSICIEGLLRLVCRNSTGGDPGYTRDDRSAVENWLARSAATLTDRFVSRLRGFLGTLNHRRPVDILRDWQRRGILGVTIEDVNAWQQTRNPSAHAALVSPVTNRGELQILLDRYHRMQNLINRIILQLVDYRGPYLDYLPSSWHEPEFPAAPPDTL